MVSCCTPIWRDLQLITKSGLRHLPLRSSIIGKRQIMVELAKHASESNQQLFWATVWTHLRRLAEDATPCFLHTGCGHWQRYQSMFRVAVDSRSYCSMPSETSRSAAVKVKESKGVLPRGIEPMGGVQVPKAFDLEVGRGFPNSKGIIIVWKPRKLRKTTARAKQSHT